MSAIVIEALGFAYQEKWVLQAIDLHVAAGEIYGLVGADGAGKTTLLRLVVGQLPPGQGAIRVLGEPAASARLRARVAYMPQGFGLYQDLSVQENLRFFADLHSLERTAANHRITDLLQRTGLAGFEQRRAGQLSGGMMQKLALACALISQPEVMVLDEPTTGVDPVSRRAFWRLLDGVRAEGVAILYATANMDEAERCDRVGLLREGRLERQGAPLALTGGEQALLVGVTGPAVRRYRTALQALPDVQWAFPVGRQLRLWLVPTATLTELRARLATVSPELQAQPLQPTLQDIALKDLALGAARR
jgi:ABC-2 type transport system ATP-binding protein